MGSRLKSSMTIKIVGVVSLFSIAWAFEVVSGIWTYDIMSAIVIFFCIPYMFFLKSGPREIKNGLLISFLTIVFVLLIQAVFYLNGLNFKNSLIVLSRIVQAITMFYFFYFCSLSKGEWFRKSVYLCFLSFLIYGVYQVITGSFVGYYGYIGLPNEPGPSQGGAVFLTASFFFMYMYFSGKRIKPMVCNLVFFLLSCLFLVLTVSRSAIFSFAAGYLVTILLLAFVKSNHLKLLSMALVYLVIGGALFKLMLDFGAFSFLFDRIDRVASGVSGRADKWQVYLSEYFQKDLPLLFFGSGFGSANALYSEEIGSFFAVDSFYVRFLYEAGAIGLFFFFLTISYAVLKLLLARSLASCFLIGYIFSILIMSSTHEIVFVGRISMVMMLFMALLMGLKGKESYEKRAPFLVK